MTRTFAPWTRTAALVLGVAAATLTQTACIPLVVGGAALGGAAVMSDRRNPTAQLDDQTIEARAASRLRELLGDRAHVSVNVYNRLVLLTGEVFNEADRGLAEQTVAKVTNVKLVVNELVAQWPSSTSDRANDMVLAGKVKATFIDAKSVPVGAFKVVVERKTVYLMGRVTEPEATRAAELTRTISGVQKVVKVVEVVSQAELDTLDKPR
jgi:osmotically-inducible protein OsmY